MRKDDQVKRTYAGVNDAIESGGFDYLMSEDVKYPDIYVPLVGEDGNAFAILGRVRSALRQHDVPADKISEFMTEATSGDYNHLLRTVMRWVNTERLD